MGIKLRITNPRLNVEERTYVDSDYSSGTTLTVRNNDGFTATQICVAGEPGQEQTESKDISSVSGSTSIVLSGAFSFAHAKGTPVYESDWDQVSVERATASGGTFSEITNSPFNISWDDAQLSTLIVDSAGATTSYYKWRFKNSATGSYSSYSGELPAAGLGRNTAGYVMGKVRNNPVAKGVTDQQMYQFMNDLQDIVYEEIPKAWWFTKEGTAVATAASTFKYSISDNWSDFKSMKYLMYEYVSGSTDNIYALTFIPEIEMRNYKTDQNQSDSDSVRMWTFYPPDTSSAKGYLAVHSTPETATCYLRPVYFFELTDIDSFDDTLVIPKPKIYEDYILYRIYDDIKGDSANADKYNLRVVSGIVSLKKLSKRQLGQREFRRFRGVRGYSKMFGELGTMSLDDYRENYW
jgi:hypothetical protein